VGCCSLPVQATYLRGGRSYGKSHNGISDKGRLSGSNALLSAVAAEMRNFSSETIQSHCTIPGLPWLPLCIRKSTEKYVRENEAVAVDPFGVLGVESHELVPDDVGHRGHTHGGTRMARVCLECGIDLCRNTKSQPLSLSKHL
jgi:hypothetical protein